MNSSCRKKGIGDVKSDAKGSGARFNEGKPPMHYIPLRQQMIVWRENNLYTDKLDEVVEELARFEQRELEAVHVVQVLTTEDLVAASYVWQYGAEKYAAWNWTKGMAWSVPLGCISRHIQAILEGEELDPESGCTHWGHVVCNLLMLEHYENYYLEGDDRPPAINFSKE